MSDLRADTGGLASSHNWLIFKLIVPALRSALEQHARGDMLDIGCGNKPYARLAAPFVRKHVGLEHADSPHGVASAELLGSAYEIPCDDGRFDTVLCTDVLEHLEEPQRAVNEAFRVLRPGGVAIYTVPLFWHIHEAPRDFYRFTRYGLEHLFRTAGFEVVEINALSGFSAMAAQELTYVLQGLGRRVGVLAPVVRAMSYGLQQLGAFANKFERAENYSMEYLAIVRKAADE